MGRAPTGRSLALGLGDCGCVDPLGDVSGELDPAAYNPVNLLWLDPDQARWSTLGDARDLTPGVHVLTVQDLDDQTSAKTVRLLGQARAAAEVAVDQGCPRAADGRRTMPDTDAAREPAER